jgi:predicted transglutaminase-like cysteine proteinase
MRRRKLIAAVAAFVAYAVWLTPAQTAFYGFPRNLKPQVERLALDQPALQPMPHTLFCLRYRDECKVQGTVFRPGLLSLNSERVQDLVSVNREVNRSISPRAYPGAVLRDTWTLAPKAGDCNDYAVTKRHMLLAKGWPSRSLLLAVVRTPSGEGHLILVVRVKQGDFVLDNLRYDIKDWAQTGYRWEQIQSPSNPQYWATVATRKKLAEVTPVSYSRSAPEPVREK